MCGRFSFLATDKIIEERLEIHNSNYTPRYNCAPGQNIAIITNINPFAFEYFKWGLLPRWPKNSSYANKFINTKAETIFEKPIFKEIVKRNRCLVPADSFFEWSNVKSKIPYRFSLNDTDVFCMAGIWDTVQSLSVELINTFSIIMGANDFVKQIHNRMPVILENKKSENLWIQNGVHHEVLSVLIPIA